MAYCLMQLKNDYFKCFINSAETEVSILYNKNVPD